MKFRDVQIDGFGVWTGLSVDSLNEGLTLFYGPNEAGKTTLMQFMRAMLYGFTDERRTRYLPPIHGGTPGGALRVSGPGGGYEIQRHASLSDNDETGRLTVTGSDGLTQGQHRLTSLLGQVDEAIYNNVFAIGIRELQELSTLDNTAAADELYKLSSGLDRVSLVDVLRNLRAGRADLVGDRDSDPFDQNASHTTTANQLRTAVSRRNRLRDEVSRLSGGTRRWSELATQRQSQSQEIDALRNRMSTWEREARCVEVATSVFDAWQQRGEIAAEIEEIQDEAYLPDEAPAQLVQIDASMEERRNKVEEIKNKRRLIRDKAEQLPVNKRLFDLQGRIEAATEQATWVEALQEQIERLDSQIDKARQQVDSDADRLGIDEDDRLRLAEGDTTPLPDLSRQTLAALSEPAKRVREETFQLKQARDTGRGHKERLQKQDSELQDVLQRANATDLQAAIRRTNDQISSLRQRHQLGEHLEKLTRHYRELERESIELTTDEALPVDRVMLLSVPFIVGGGLIFYGLFNVAQITTFVSEPNPNTGMLYILFGAMAMLVYYLGRERGQRTTAIDLEDCERQIESIRRQIREVETERHDIDDDLPTNLDAIESRMRESESLLNELESVLPVYHAREVALQSYQSARSHATHAAEGLRDAKRQWTTTLERLGLSKTMSPKSVRTLGDGYETLQASIKRLNDLHDERQLRRREQQTIAKRIESLYLEAIDARDEVDLLETKPSLKASDAFDTESEVSQLLDAPEHGETRSHKRRMPSNPLDQLNHLHEELARQQHWIKQRRHLRDQDAELKKHQSSQMRAIERAEQQRRALWAKCGVATSEQFYGLVDRKSQLAELNRKHDELDRQIRSIIGANIPYEDVEYEINGVSAADLERRWESLTTQMTDTETRIGNLQTAKGQLAQEMKQLGEDNRLMTTRLELNAVESQIEKLVSRWQTMGTASTLLEDVCSTFERERQPETLREASSYLQQLTNRKYVRIWTPLGTNQLKIDDANGKSLPLEVLSRGTGEAVFIALRLSLASAYARRGVMLPLVLDDVLVNFDGDRAEHAARTLQTFAQLGHQVMMFTCHDHIADIFHRIDAEVRGLPAQGTPGRAYIMMPEEVEELGEEEYEYEDTTVEEESVTEEPVAEEIPETEPVAVIQPPAPEPVVVPEPKPVKLVVEDRRPRKRVSPYRYRLRRIARMYRERAVPEVTVTKTIRRKPVLETTEVAHVTDPIGWAWFEREPADGRVDADEATAQAARNEWLSPEDRVVESGNHALDESVVSSDADMPSWWREQSVEKAS